MSRTPFRGRPRGDSAPWFFEWLGYHQTLHGSKYWVRPDDDNAPTFYRGWIEEFDRAGISSEDAHRVSRLLQAETTPKGGVKEQLRWVVGRYRELRREERAAAEAARTASPRVSAEELLAAERSIGCPECSGPDGPTGWARRRMQVDGFPWALFVELYCRCPLGRFREATAPDRDRGAGRAWSDLQLHPELWDGRLDHPSWDWSDPCEVSWHEPGDGWRYLEPREAEAYRGPTRAELAAILAPAPAPKALPSPRPRDRWPAGDPILDAERSRRDAPPPPPEPAPAADDAEGVVPDEYLAEAGAEAEGGAA